MNTVMIQGVEKLHALAARLAARLRVGDCIALNGDLGAGKTEFARGCIRALCGEGTEVTSPTFTIVQPYEAVVAQEKNVPLWHVDLYRLEAAEELQALGLEEALQHGICLIEWPALAESLLPDDKLNIHINIKDGYRELRLHGEGDWPERIKEIL